MAREPAHRQHRGEDDIDDHGKDGDEGGHLHVADATQHGAHGDGGELQRHRGNEPGQIRCALGRGGVIGRERVHVDAAQEERDDAKRDAGERGQHERLVEDETGALPVVCAHRLGDERRGADAERLRQRQHNHHHVAGEAHTGDRFLAELAHEIQIDQEVHRLEQRGQRDKRRKLQDVDGNRSLGQILHA
jgi:hypothetical protein